MFPHERSLVERLKDEPFALIGVNSDDDFAEKKEKEFKDEKITWRSFQNAASKPAISEQWRVKGWPTLYLIDAQGRIRQKWLGSPSNETLDQEIDKLVAIAKGGKGDAPSKPAPAKQGG